MKKLLLTGSIATLLLPSLAFAAYNDVTLTSSASVSLNAGTLNVVGDSNVIETMTVTATELSFTLDNGSKLKVSSPTFRQLTHSAASVNISTSVCESTESSINFTSSTDDVTVTVGIKSASCPEGSNTTGGSSASGGGATTANSVAVVATTATKEAQIASLMQAIAALQAQMQSLTGAPAAQVSAIGGKITSNLSAGSRGVSVKTLQQFLNTHGFVIASSGPGSLGNETENFGTLTVQAVRKFQEQYNIAKPGVPGYGTVGPKTRAKINELSGN